MTSPKRGTTTRNACNGLCESAGGRIIPVNLSSIDKHGCESLKARGTSRNSARCAAFSILSTSFGGLGGMASAMPVTLRVPRSLTSTQAAARCESWVAVVHQAQLEHSMFNSLGAPSRQLPLVQRLTSAHRAPVSNTKAFCVYALYREGEVVYVGSSTWVPSRILQHISSGKDFDSYSFIQVNSIEEMHEAEVRCIVELDPEYNHGLASTQKSGFVSMASMKARYELGTVALKKQVKKANVETLYFRGCAYYNVKQMDVAMGVTE